MSALLDIRNLTIELETPQGRVQAVEKVNLLINEGEIQGLVGESGSGKSLVAKAILGLQSESWHVHADRMHWKGVELSDLPIDDRRELIGRELGFIFQEPMSCLDPMLTVAEQLVEVLPHHQCPYPYWNLLARHRWRAAEAKALLHRVGITQHKRVLASYPHELSEGLCQKVMIAMAIASGPKLLIADEPTAQMEATTEARIFSLLAKLNQLGNMSVLLITHDLESIIKWSHSITVMYSGQTVEAGPTQSILARPHHPYTEALLRSVPHFEEGLDHKCRLHTLPGAIPPLQHLPIGCRLGPRCPRAQRKCVEKPLVKDLKGHRFACHFPINMED
ncbi:ATP-binding cassette domain-containing protein [Gallaecimonas kandeliae]|uniref:peptide ABC transporter ATP-binding protein n=1 Tax=Gallaecimonas kandeliae TaxID=3029055 RepID=UPI002648DB46|nr:oligopeptide/dipeptide ABC transporter ATP-binding protein [Gallaecimonas kandeliae]WKE64132.1 ATP-binding cassette domain-containing protein [Gallaecimonas kandeliae]